MIINDENSLGKELDQLSRDIATCIEVFERKAGTGFNVELVWTAIGKSAIVEDEPMWRVTAMATLKDTDTNTIISRMRVEGDE